MSIFNPERTFDSDVWVMDGAAITFGSYGYSAYGGGSATGDTDVDATGPDKMPAEYGTPDDGTIVAIACSIAYQRNIQRRYPINVRRAIYLVGMPEGTITFQMLFGPGITLRNFIDKFNHVDETTNTTIMVTPFSTSNAAGNNGIGANQGTWKITKPVLQSIGLNIQESGSADIQSVGNVTMQFTEMDILDDDTSV
jgi:hypothetical protein